SVQVTVYPSLTIIPIANRLKMCKNETVAFTAIGGTAYAWSWGLQTSSSPTIAITPTVITILAVNVTGTATSGCTNTGSVTVEVYSCNGMNELNQADTRILIYPNPSQGD